MSEAILDCKDLRKVFSNNGAEVESLVADINLQQLATWQSEYQTKERNV